MLSRMTIDAAASVEVSEAVHNHFLDVKRAHPEKYSGFDEVKFSPDNHNLNEVVRGYHGDEVKTDFTIDFGGPAIAANFETDLVPSAEAMIKQYGLEKRLQDRSLIILMNHFFITDIAATQGAWIRASVAQNVYNNSLEAAAHNASVQSRFIDVLGSKFTDGSLTENASRHLGHVIRTLPATRSARLGQLLSREDKREHNDQVKLVKYHWLQNPGVVMVMAPGATQDPVSEDGRQMKINLPGEETVYHVVDSGAMVLICLVKCKPLVNRGGFEADEHAFLKPVDLFPKPTVDLVYSGFAHLAQLAVSEFQQAGLPDLQQVSFRGNTTDN